MSDFAKRFYVRGTQIYQGYMDPILISFVCNGQQIGYKIRNTGDSKGTYHINLIAFQLQTFACS